MRLVNRLLSVLTAGDLPVAFTWQGRDYTVGSVLEVWSDTGEWWRGEKEKIFYRVSAGDGLYELYQESGTSNWYLYKIYD